ncbi:MAG: DegV family protein [Anaeroplasmataceae bacterium]
MSYVIITDSTTDLSEELVSKWDLKVMPMHFTIGQKEYLNYPDGREISNKDFYNELRNGKMATTSQLNSEYVYEYFKGFLEEGHDILALIFSSGLSGSFNAVRLATEQLKEEYQNRKILIIDSLCASMGEGLFAYYGAMNKKDGMTIEENYEYLNSIIHNIAHWFTVGDIDFLKRGGRLSNASAFVAKILKINPVLHVDDKGHLVARMKKIGRKNAINELVNQLDKTIDRNLDQVIFISHGDCYDEALALSNKIKEVYEPVDVIIGEIGPVIGAHSGPGTLAVFFLANHR